jgi:hypothetical protein
MERPGEINASRTGGRKALGSGPHSIVPVFGLVVFLQAGLIGPIGPMGRMGRMTDMTYI